MRILVLLFVLLPILVIGQKSVGLKFTDVQDNSPLVSASVKIVEKTNLSVYLTDTFGTINFSAQSDTIKIILSHTSIEGEFFMDISLDSLDAKAPYKEIKVNTRMIGLDTLVVTKSRNPIQYTEGKILFDPNLDPSLKGRPTQDVLNRVPLVQVDASGDISLRGNSNVRILLNGSDIADLGLNQKDILKIISTSNIDRIEVSPNSGAESDGESSSGHINILTKSRLATGAKGELGLNGKLGNSHEFSPNANFSYGLSKLNVYLSSGATNFKTVGTTVLNNVFSGSSQVSQAGDLKYTGTPYFVNAGLFYSLGKGTSVRYSGVFNKNAFDYLTNLDAINESQGVKSYYSLSNKNDFRTSNFANSLELKKEFQDGGILTISGTFSKGNSRTHGFSDREGRIDSNYYNNLQKVYIGQADYNLKRSKLRYYMGLKLINRNFQDQVNGNFDNNNHIYSGYFQTLLNLGQYSLLIGLRNEYTRVNGLGFESDYNSLLPNAGLYRKIKNGQLGLSYSQKIFRPGINVLNPNRIRVSDVVFMEGDPNIRPETNHSIAFNVQKYFSERFNMYWDIKYVVNNDFIARSTKQEGEKTIFSYTNLGHIEEWSSSLNSSFSLFKGLDWTIQANVDYARITAPDVAFNNKWHFNLSNELRYSFKGYTAELNHYFYTAKYFYQNRFLSPSVSQFTIHKSFGQCNVYLGTINPFNERAKYRNEYTSQGIVSTNLQNIHIRSITFGITYNFGNQKVRNKTGEVLKDNAVKDGSSNPIGGN